MPLPSVAFYYIAADCGGELNQLYYSQDAGARRPWEIIPRLMMQMRRAVHTSFQQHIIHLRTYTLNGIIASDNENYNEWKMMQPLDPPTRTSATLRQRLCGCQLKCANWIELNCISAILSVWISLLLFPFVGGQWEAFCWCRIMTDGCTLYILYCRALAWTQIIASTTPESNEIFAMHRVQPTDCS
jgi:hypothetical protein